MAFSCLLHHFLFHEMKFPLKKKIKIIKSGPFVIFVLVYLFGSRVAVVTPHDQKSGADIQDAASLQSTHLPVFISNEK